MTSKHVLGAAVVIEIPPRGVCAHANMSWFSKDFFHNNRKDSVFPDKLLNPRCAGLPEL